jgi:hypothetical protein
MLRNKQKGLVVLAIIMLSYIKSNAQGCSDAGFCTMVNHSNPLLIDSSDKAIIQKFGLVYGLGEGATNAISPYYSISLKMKKNIVWNNKITAQYAFGDLGKATNFGDFLSSITLSNESKNKNSTHNFIAGIKIPLNFSNASDNGKILPMAYQSSLGTVDLIGGLNLNYKKVFIQSAIQLPTINLNKNSYLQNSLTDTVFNSTNKFERKPDALIRVGYALIANNNWKFTPNILAIYHFANDTYLNSKSDKISLIGSHGLTLNFNLLIAHKINKKNAFEISVAAPFVVRKIRPDGLTRALSIGVEYQF